MTRILLHARDPREWIAQSQLTKESFLNSYNNTGNLVWNYGISKALHHPDNQVKYNDFPLNRKSAEEINSNFDHIVFSFANLINPKYKWRIEKLLQFLPYLNLPITVCSLGVQCDESNYKSFLDPIKKETLSLLKHLCNHSTNIGTRGLITAEILSQLGFGSHVKPIGCPSFYIKGSQFQAPKVTKWCDSQKEGVFNDNKPSRELLFEAAKRIFGDNFKYVTQDYVCQKTCVDEVLLRLVGKRKLYVFTKFANWTNAVKGGFISVSSRIHGTVASIHAGVPSLLVAIDKRTSELAQHIGISTISRREIESAKTPDDLIQHVKNDFLQIQYKRRYREFVDFLHENNLTHFEDPGAEQPHVYYEDHFLSNLSPEPPEACLVRFDPNHPIYQDLEKYLARARLRRRAKRLLSPFVS